MRDQQVEVVAWDPAWAGRFSERRPAIEAALGGLLTGPVQHVGSTAVPGLGAKPVVDMLATVRSLAAARARVPQLSTAGWLYWPDDPEREHRLWFLSPRPESRTHHLHVIETGDPRAVALVAFRDALRADPALRQQYAALKNALAQRHRDDRNAYTDAKSAFVDAALRHLGLDPPPRTDQE